MTESRRIGKYEILEEIGRGGFAIVYKACDTELDRIVALKVLHPQLTTDPMFIRRFQREAKTAAGLHHPHIVTIHEVGEDAGQYYLAMEFLPGRTLEQRLDLIAGPLPMKLAVSIVEQVAEALDTIHDQGLVHRDIKPSNIMVSEKGYVTLLDFGIARAAGGTRLTTKGVLGTIEYMAPEQAELKDMGETDWRADIYSLGVVAYEMLVGQPPFTGESPTAILYKHVHEEPPAPTTLRSDLPAALEPVLLNALAKQQKDRYQSAGEMAQALRKAVETGKVVLPQHKLRQLSELYRQARACVSQGAWMEAKRLCLEIENLASGYRNVSELLMLAEDGLHREQAQGPPTAPPPSTTGSGFSPVAKWVFGGGAAAILTIVVVMAWILSGNWPHWVPKTPTPSSVAVSTQSLTETSAPTPTNTLGPTDIPTLTPTDTSKPPTPTPTDLPTPTPTDIPTPTPTDIPTPTPTDIPTPTPTDLPTPTPTNTPTIPETSGIDILWIDDCDPRSDPDFCMHGDLEIFTQFYGVITALDARISYIVPTFEQDLDMYDVVIANFCGPAGNTKIINMLKGYVTSGGSVIAMGDEFCQGVGPVDGDWVSSAEAATYLTQNWGVSFTSDDVTLVQWGTPVIVHPLIKDVSRLYAYRHAYLQISSPSQEIISMNGHPFVALYEQTGTLIAIPNVGFHWGVEFHQEIAESDNFVFWRNMLSWLAEQSQIKRK